MDTDTVAVAAVVAAFVAAIVGAILGSVVGPSLTARFDRLGTRAAFIREQRRDAYTAFTVLVEEAQRKADATTAGIRGSLFAVSDLDQLELARVRIDLFGTHLAKVWAYRCTLTLIELRGLLHGEVTPDLWCRVVPLGGCHHAQALSP